MRLLKANSLTVKKPTANKVGAAVVAIAAALLLSACAGQPPANLGVIKQANLNTDTQAGSNSYSIGLRACPDSPNCIQTYDAADDSHFKAPLIPKATIQQTTDALKTAIKNSGGEIISEQALLPAGYYLHAEYTSKWIRFVDDVEVVVQADSIQFRSASRIGRSDFGVNGERFDTLKTIYQAQP